MATDFSSLEAFVLDKMGETRLAGVSLAVVAGDEIIYRRGFGCEQPAEVPPTAAGLLG